MQSNISIITKIIKTQNTVLNHHTQRVATSITQVNPEAKGESAASQQSNISETSAVSASFKAAGKSKQNSLIVVLSQHPAHL